VCLSKRKYNFTLVAEPRAMSEIREANSVETYNGTNFQLWKMHMRFIFQSRELFSIVNGSLKKSDLTDPAEQLIWEKHDKQAIVAILATIDSFHKDEVINCSTSHEMWSQLQAYHDQHSDDCIIALQEKYYSCKLGDGESIATFISTLQRLAKQLTELKQPITEQQLISKIKCGLPSSFDPLLLAWESVPLAEQTLLAFQTRLIKFQGKLRERGTFLDAPNDKAYFTTTTPAHAKPSPSVEQKKERADRHAKYKKHARCYRCGHRGHFGKDCPEDSDSSSPASPKHMVVPHKSSGPRKHRHHKGKRSHAHITASAPAQDSSASYSSASSEAYCVQLDTTPADKLDTIHEDDTAWFADSGATEHMTDKLRWFTNFEAIDDRSWSVTIADDHLLYVRGIGDIYVHTLVNGEVSTIKLKNVLYVPKLRRNLISTGRLTERCVAIIHVRDMCKMISHDGEGHIVMTGQKCGGLWRLHISTVNKPSAANLVATTPVSHPGSSKSNLTLQRWHARLGHVSVSTLKKMSSQDLVLGLPSFESTTSSVCSGCAYGKSHRTPFPVNADRKRMHKPGLFVHADISGPFQVQSYGGHYYFITYKDDHSSYRFVFFLKDKKNIMSTFQTLYKQAKKETGRSMIKLRTDNGREFLSHDFQAYVQHKGIRHELTSPYSPEQNSVIERDNRTVVECARSMLHHRSLPLELWGEAVNTAVYILNRVSSRTLHGATPFTKWYGELPDVSYFREFGSLCYGHVPKQIRRKLGSKALECLFVGYCTTAKAYRLWCLNKRKIIITRDVIFDEATPTQHQLQPATSQGTSNYSLLFPSDIPVSISVSSSANTIPSMSSPSLSVGTSQPKIHEAVGVSPTHLQEAVGASSSNSPAPMESPTARLSTSRDASLSSPLSQSFQVHVSSSGSSDTSPLPDSFDSVVSSTQISSHEQSISPPDSSISPDLLNPTLKTRSLDDVYKSAPPVQSHFCVAASKAQTTSRVSVLPPEPQTFAQALKSDHKAEWELAMMEEIESLLKNETWTLETLPPGHNLVKNKWVFRIKVKSDGTIERFKARLVAKGFTQTYGMDYQETFAPTARAESIRIILSIAGADGLHMVQFDIKTAYLNSTIQELIFMALPQGFEEWFLKKFPGSRGKVCRIRKGLYGLKQSARSWNKTFSDFLKAYDLIQSTADSCIFYSTSHPRLILALWVDDGLAICQDKALLAKMITHLKTKFEVTRRRC
jgi:hypothetical protein